MYVQQHPLPQIPGNQINQLHFGDGHWRSDPARGEIVLEGAYELKLASSRTSEPLGGHFHADGTFHSGEDH